MYRPSERWLSWIAGFKLVKGTFLLAACVAAVGLLDPSWSARLSHWAMVLAADRHYRVLDSVVRLLATVDPRTIRVFGLGSFLYATIFYAEGFGLYRRRRWAEYMTIVTTGGLIPFELFELNRRVTPEKLAVLVANLFILAYLTYHVAVMGGPPTKTSS